MPAPVELQKGVDLGARLRTLTVRAAKVHSGDYRLDAAFYEGDWAENTIEAGPYAHVPLRDLADVWFPGRFTRNYRPTGTPFIGSREMLFWPIRPSKFLAQTQTNVEQLYVEPGDILVRRSGSVGATVRVTADFEGIGVSEHALRVRPKGKAGGYLYALLRSDLGQAIMERKAFGAVVNELAPEHLLSIPVPIPGEATIDAIAKLMDEACALQAEGARQILAAQFHLQMVLGLGAIDELSLLYATGGASGLRTFTINSDDLQGRLDGSFHRPEIRAVRSALSSASAETASLGSRCDVEVPGRFKRVYVEEEVGSPLLQGVHVPMVRPEGIKYLSRIENARQHDTHRLSRDTVLVTCSGTLGRVGIVGRAQEGWLASQHIARVLPRGDAHPGFVYAFLATEYGQTQILGQTYGAVIDELSEQQLMSVLVPWLDPDQQAAIGDQVIDAFEKRDRALDLEVEAISLLRSAIS